VPEVRHHSRRLRQGQRDGAREMRVLATAALASFACATAIRRPSMASTWARSAPRHIATTVVGAATSRRRRRRRRPGPRRRWRRAGIRHRAGRPRRNAMSLFKCDKCGAVENTALSRFWFREIDPKTQWFAGPAPLFGVRPADWQVAWRLPEGTGCRRLHARQRRQPLHHRVGPEWKPEVANGAPGPAYPRACVKKSRTALLQ
jgi:hypothetical protein